MKRTKTSDTNTNMAQWLIRPWPTQGINSSRTPTGGA